MTTVVRPAAVGTHRFSAKIDAAYCAGRDHVGTALEMLLRRTRIVSMDIETFGLGVEARKLKSVSFGTYNYAVVLDPRDPLQYDLILMMVEEAEVIVTHNGPYDVINMHLNGLFPIHCVDKVTDTIIYSRFAEPSDLGGHDLFKAGKKFAGLDGDNQVVKGFKALNMAAENGWRIFDIDRPIYIQGAAADVIVTARIHAPLMQAAYDQTTKGHPFTNHGVTGTEAMELIEREQEVNRCLLKRACKGFIVDLEYADKYRQVKQGEREESERELEKLGITPADSADLIRWLSDNDQLPANHPRTPTGQLSGNKKHVERINHPIVALFLRHKQDLKIEKDYLQKCIDLSVCGEDGRYRVFSATAVMKAATGRASMSDPPLHQFNGPARGILLAEPGDEMVSIDWSAIEPVLVANMAGEESMYRHYETWFEGKAQLSGPHKGEVTFNDRAQAFGDYGDMYESIALEADVDRKIAKIILLAQLYGEGIVKLSGDLNTTEMSAKELRDSIFANIPNVERFIRSMKDLARNHSKIMTMSGRIIPVPWATYDGTYSVQAHKGVNYTVQGSAYDVLAETVRNAAREGLGHGIYWTMHDEVICSRDVAERLRKIMETPPERLCRLSGRVPMLRTDMNVMGERWLSV